MLNLIIQSFHDNPQQLQTLKMQERPKRKEKNSRRRKEGDQNYIPSNAALAASADGTGHLHELFLVHGGQRWRVACARNESSHREGEKCSRRETRVTGPVSLVEPGPDCGPSSSCSHCKPDSEPVLVPALHSEQDGTLNWNQHPPGPTLLPKFQLALL